ncbi:MAG: hypothetical protein CL916_10735 [Deltaproteobacteria bacterium]|nr:hypothetical protein [Deltaproteobacteria bacterium]
MLFSFLFYACTQEQPTDYDQSTCGTPNEQVAVITSMDFARRDDDGAALGFNLDNHETDFGDNEGCGLQDISAPDGSSGIDNAFSGLLPALEATQAVAINGLIEDSLRNGELILLLELSYINDLENDTCMNFGLWRGEGTPMIGTDGSVLDGQSFSRSTLDPGLVETIPLSNSSFIAGPFDYTLPVQVLDVFVSFTMQEAYLSGNIRSDGSIYGYFGGSVALDDFKAITELGDIGNVGELLDTLLAQASDMDIDGDGECDAISLVFTFDSVQSFFIEE